MRSSLLDEIGEDYLTTARAKGLRDVVVRRRHATRNALLPTTTLIALSIGFVVSGAITVETVFSIPGLGLLATEALTIPDYWVLQGTFLVTSAGRDRRQPDRQPDLRPPRPAGPVMTTTPEAAATARRPAPGDPAAAGHGRQADLGQLPQPPLGPVRAGPADLLHPGRDLRAAARRRGEHRGHQGDRRRARAARRRLPARHRRERPLDRRAADLGLADLPVRRPAGDADLDGDRHAGRPGVRASSRAGRPGCSTGSPSGSSSSRSCRSRSCWPPCSAGR